MKMNTTSTMYQQWLQTETKLSSNLNEPEDIFYLEELFYDIVDAFDMGLTLMTGEIAVDDNSNTALEIKKVLDKVHNRKTTNTSGNLFEKNFYNSCVKFVGETNITKASDIDDYLGSTDFFLYGYRIDVTTKHDPNMAITNSFYYAEMRDDQPAPLRVNAYMLNRNAVREFNFPILSLVFSGHINQEKLEMYIQQHLTKTLLEFNKLCRVFKYI
jgi:hypothetical protein